MKKFIPLILFALTCLVSRSQNTLFTGSVATPYCAGTSISVSFSSVAVFNNGNKFIAQLSNASGSFAAPLSTDSMISTSPSAITVHIPVSTPTGTAYRIRVISTSPAITGSDNGANITINAIPAAPSISVNSVCLSRDTLSVSGASGATAIQWWRNSSILSHTYSAYTPTTAAGDTGHSTAANRLYGPQDVYLDSLGYMYVCDTKNHRIQKFPPGSTSATNATTVAGGNGPGSAANQLQYPYGVYVDRSGNIYVADMGNYRVQKFPANSTSATNGVTIAGGNGTGSAANQFAFPEGVYVDGTGNVYVGDYSNHRVMKFPANSTSATNGTIVAGGNGAGSAANQLNNPSGIWLDASGNLYVADYSNNRVQKFPAGSTSTTNGITVAGGNGSGTSLNQISPLFACTDAAGGLYVADMYSSRILKFAANSNSASYGFQIAGDIIPYTAYSLMFPAHVSLAASGAVYIADDQDNRIQKYTPSPALTTHIPNHPGTYTANYISAAGCSSAMSNAIVIDTFCFLKLTDTVASAACNGTASGVVKLTAHAGTRPYQYKISGGAYQSTTNTYSNLAAGTYTFYVKDSLGAIDSAVAVIAQSSPINITGTITSGTTQYINTTVSGGVAPYHYQWPGFVAWNGSSYGPRDSSFIRGDSYPTTLFGGSYLVMVTDQNGCTAADSFIINPTTTLRFTTYIKSGSCYANGNADDSVVIVGSGGTPFTGSGGQYALRLGTAYTGFTNLFKYAVYSSGIGFATIEDQVTDYSSYYRYSIPTPLVVSGSATPTSGGLSNGSIAVTASGAQTPYTYTWAGSTATTASRTGLAAGTYTVTVREAGGCSVVKTYTVAGPPVLTDTITNAPCYGATGMVALHAANGATPYQYKKGNGSYQSSNRFTGLTAGTYKFYVLDSLGGVDSITAIVTQPTQVTAPGTVTNTSGGLNNGAISVVASGGRPPYHYAWSGSSVTTSSRSNLASGTYYLTVTDSAGCGVVDTFQVAASSGNAVVLYLDTIAGNIGQVATVHVKVKNFKKIVSAQASIQFTPSVITYANVSQFGTSSLNASNFGTTSAGSGILTFAWSDPTLSGVTLTDGSVLFAINYNVVGGSGTSSPVSLVSSPTQIEVADTSFNPIPYVVSPGLVTVNSSVTISGRISSWNINKGVRKTTVSFAGSTHTSVLTDTSGRYSFTVAAGAADTITPSRNSDSIRANGVTTVDILMVQRYILGTYAITGPYKLIAADVNGSGSVTSLDYTLMQSLILGNTTTFPGNKLWTFVPTSYTFGNPQSPWGYPTARYYASASAQTAQDFTGIKLGDVSGDWNPLLAKTQANDSLQLYVQPAAVHQGQDTALTVRARYFRGISGMQFTLAWDSTQLTFTGIDSTSPLHVNYGSGSASSGLLGIQWTDPNGTSTYMPDDSTLFRVYFHVIGAAGDSSLLRFDSTVTTVQFIDSDLNIVDATLQSGKISIANTNGVTATAADAITVYPNPATSEILVDLGALPSEKAEISIRDVSGKTVYTKDISGQRNHSVPVRDWAEGVYMIQIRYAQAVKTIKLTVIHP